MAFRTVWEDEICPICGAAQVLKHTIDTPLPGIGVVLECPNDGSITVTRFSPPEWYRYIEHYRSISAQ